MKTKTSPKGKSFTASASRILDDLDREEKARAAKRERELRARQKEPNTPRRCGCF